MFKSGSRDRDDGASHPAAPAGSKRGMFSVIGADVTVTGNIAASADLHIDGRVEGDVACGTLVQGADSVIVGGVGAETARIAGAVEGAVRVRELQVEKTARISGDVEYETIVIENGARVDGNLRHKSKGTIASAPTTTSVTNVTPIARPSDDGAQAPLLA